MTDEEFDELIAETVAYIRRVSFSAPASADEREHALHSQHAEYGGGAH
ncbi:hypothetical protein [Streptomyces chryseus]|nr:hypothetical protein [Streptomyces chryseus]